MRSDRRVQARGVPPLSPQAIRCGPKQAPCAERLLASLYAPPPRARAKQVVARRGATAGAP